MNEQRSNLNKSEEAPKDTGRRKFLEGMFAGAVVAIPGILTVNKYVEHEKEMEELVETFRGKEEDFVSAHKATIFLLDEIEKRHTASFQFDDPKDSERVAFLKSFLIRHLQSSVGYQYPFKSEILNLKRFDRTGLMQILVWSDKTIKIQKPVPPIDPPKKGFNKIVV